MRIVEVDKKIIEELRGSDYYQINTKSLLDEKKILNLRIKYVKFR